MRRPWIRLSHPLDDVVLKDVLTRLVDVARRQRVIRGRRPRVDTTVVKTNIHHPTDSTLLANGVRVRFADRSVVRPYRFWAPEANIY